MSFLYYTLLAAGSLPALVLGTPLPSLFLARIVTIETASSAFSHSLAKRGIDVYRMYSGNGQSSWPGADQWWGTFDEMFNANRNIMKDGCTQFHVAANSDKETNDISAAIKQVSGETGVDARFILSILLQESNGCVRAPTTNYGVRNPGLMQDHDGASTCNEHGNIQNPCPTHVIAQMIRDGVAGTPAGDGLVQTLKQAPGSGAAKYYAAARIYNSGSIDASGDLSKGIATKCYSSDIANRLLGWVYSNKACPLDGGSSAPSIPVSAPPPAPATPDVPTNIAQAAAVPKPVIIASPISVNKIPTTSAATKAVSTNMAPGVTADCAQYYRIQNGDFCIKVSDKFSLSFDKFRQLNSGVDGACSNLWLGYDYCVKPL